MPPFQSLVLRLTALVSVTGLLALTLVTVPATAATQGVGAAHGSAARGHDELSLQGDTAPSAARSRRASYAWPGRKILYTETLPTKWDWSLATAINKWNSSGGGIRFVKTTRVRKARLNIAYGNIGAASGMASVGRSKHAWVRLSTSYGGRDASDGYNRVEVMAVLTHELGHVLGFEHTSAQCSLMSAVMDLDRCGVVPAALPGYYKCRTIDPALLLRFVRTYGGTARYPASYCLIDPLPSQLTGVAFSGGVSAPVTIRWARPAYLPSGSRVQIRIWNASTCGSVPAWAESVNVSATARAWNDSDTGRSGQLCFRVNLVNRLGAGRTPAARLMTLAHDQSGPAEFWRPDPGTAYQLMDRCGRLVAVQHRDIIIDQRDGLRTRSPPR